MSGLMTSMKTDVPKQYRARAQEARAKADALEDEAARQRLVHEAEVWERMADYEENKSRGG
jgi:hypothetical protein